ncbi:conserved hypothetical protein, partial [Trichinella spiralis]|uniref:hypothetical protein n=1 Tax=Trichinella spiralis TaxID=6334 RepID=UPI0001EFED52
MQYGAVTCSKIADKPKRQVEISLACAIEIQYSYIILSPQFQSAKFSSSNLHNNALSRSNAILRNSAILRSNMKLFCSLDCCPSGALSTIFPLFKTNQEIV